MTFGPFPLSPLVDRLTPIPELRVVGIAADLATALKALPATIPAAYVVREERALETTYGTGVQLQKVDAAIAVVYFVRNYARSDTGGGARDEMDALIAAGRARLIGWRPSSDYTPLRLHSSNENVYSGAVLVSQETYLSTYRVRSPA